MRFGTDSDCLGEEGYSALDAFFALHDSCPGQSFSGVDSGSLLVVMIALNIVEHPRTTLAL